MKKMVSWESSFDDIGIIVGSVDEEEIEGLKEKPFVDAVEDDEEIGSIELT